MGYRLHVRTINKIEYGCGHFNSDSTDDVVEILRENFEGGYFSEDESNIEISKTDFLKGIQHIKAIPAADFSRQYPSLVKAGYSKTKFVEALQDMYDSADPDDANVTMDWF